MGNWFSSNESVLKSCQVNEISPNLTTIVSKVDELYLNISNIGANLFVNDQNLEKIIIELQEEVEGLSNLTDKIGQYLERSRRNDNVILIHSYVITIFLGFIVILCFMFFCIVLMRFKHESLPNDPCEIPLKKTMECKIYSENGSEATVENSDLYGIPANKC